MSKPSTGTRYTYSAEKALGEAHMPAKAVKARHAAVDPDVVDDEPDAADYRRQMANLDMQPGMEVEYVGWDDERDLVLLQWVDAEGTTRITSVEPDHFNDHFTKGA